MSKGGLILAIMKNIEDFLLEGKYITETQLKKAKEIQTMNNMRLDKVLVEEGFISDKEMIEILALNMGLPSVNLNSFYIDLEVVQLVPEYLARKHLALPIKIDGNSLIVALSDPLNIFAIDDLRIATEYDIQVVIATKTEIEKAIEIYYKQNANIVVNEIEIIDDELGDVEKAPVVRLVNTLIYQAVKKMPVIYI